MKNLNWNEGEDVNFVITSIEDRIKAYTTWGKDSDVLERIKMLLDIKKAVVKWHNSKAVEY